MLFVTNLTRNSFTTQNSKTHALFTEAMFFTLQSDLKSRSIFQFHLTFLQLNVIKMFSLQ